jgi:hypothetical protein
VVMESETTEIVGGLDWGMGCWCGWYRELWNAKDRCGLFFDCCYFSGMVGESLFLSFIFVLASADNVYWLLFVRIVRSIEYQRSR